MVAGTVPSSRAHLIALAAQGDPNAIAVLFNQALQPRGIRVLAKRSAQNLIVVLESVAPLPKDPVVRLLMQGFERLKLQSVERILLYGRPHGWGQPAWMQRVEWEIPTPAPRPLSSPIPIPWKPLAAACTVAGLVGAGLSVRSSLQPYWYAWIQPQSKETAPTQPKVIPTAIPTPPPTPTPAAFVPPTTVGQPWGSQRGLLQFRGNPTRTWYGRGPVPADPEVQWRYPATHALCGDSSVGSRTYTWCGTGWTGQPAIWERPDGLTEVVVGAYDYGIHFLNWQTGSPTRPSFPTGDLVKGSVTLDPDGYPLLYFGSRDDELRVVALDQPTPKQLWALNANIPGAIWNNDWDGNPVIINDWMFEGGENGWLFGIKLNRHWTGDGKVAVQPKVMLQIPGFNTQLFNQVGDYNVSIENSVAVYRDRLYFANSGGRVMGIDLEKALGGQPWQKSVVFDFWAGDDIDASIVVDAQGFLYVAAEKERRGSAAVRSSQVGQLFKLDPRQSGDQALVWSLHLPERASDGSGGIWATPALYQNHLYVPTHTGKLLAVDATTGKIVWQTPLGWHSWSSPAVVDDQLIVADCSGTVRNYALSNPAEPKLKWKYALPSGGVH